MKRFILHSSAFILCTMALYAIVLSWLSLARHAAHQTNALDLGYYSNTLWNTIHGAPFRFTTYHDAQFAFPEFAPSAVKQQDNLLSYHVEPILLPLSLLYLIWPDPRALLILQSLVLASGAIPAYSIARRHFAMGEQNSHPYLPLAFPIIYLISPSLIGANLSDFHPVTMSAPLVLWAFEMRERHAYQAYFIFVALLLALKEEMGLLVAMLGLFQVYRSLIRFALPLTRRGLQMVLRHERVRVGLLTFAVAAAWTLIALLIQREAAGKQVSLFAARYSWLGHSIPEVLQNIFTTTAVLDWLQRPDVNGYIGFLFAQVGFVALLAPDVLLIAAPEIAINSFSRFDWMHSGVAHYSAPIVPVLVIASIFGVKRVADAVFWFGYLRPRAMSNVQSPKRALSAVEASDVQRHASWIGSRPILTALVLLALSSAAHQFYRSGQTPLTQDFTPWIVSAHHERLAPIMARIPSNATVTTQSDLYPHVPARANVYLFPTISDADYILLDVSGQTYPLSASDYASAVQQLVYESPAGVVAADDGYLLLARNEGSHADLPDSFFSFLRADGRAITHALRVRFGDDLELLGYDFEILPPRQVPLPSATIRTYWRALRTLDTDARFMFRFYAPQGFLGNTQSGSPAELWYPTTKWRTDEIIIVEQRAVQVVRGGKIGMRVEFADQDAPTMLPAQTSEGMIEPTVLKLLDVK